MVIAIVAVVLLMPESTGDRSEPGSMRSASRSPSVGLALVTYGLIKAGNDGWGDGSAIGTMAAGAVALAAFALVGAADQPRRRRCAARCR